MYRSLFRRRERASGRRGPRSRAAGCLLWVLLLIVLLIVLSLMFGGFRKGTKAGGLGGPHSMTVASSVTFLAAGRGVATGG